MVDLEKEVRRVQFLDLDPRIQEELFETYRRAQATVDRLQYLETLVELTFRETT